VSRPEQGQLPEASSLPARKRGSSAFRAVTLIEHGCHGARGFWRGERQITPEAEQQGEVNMNRLGKFTGFPLFFAGAWRDAIARKFGARPLTRRQGDAPDLPVFFEVTARRDTGFRRG
jgi:hypothetical protein